MKTLAITAAALAGLLVSGICRAQTPDADVGQTIDVDVPYTIEHHVYEPAPITLRLHPRVTQTTTLHERELPAPAPVVQYRQRVIWAPTCTGKCVPGQQVHAEVHEPRGFFARRKARRANGS